MGSGVLRSALKITDTNAVKTLRQRAQILLAVVTAALLFAVSVGGTVLARRADAQSAVTSQKIAVTLLGEARVQKRAEFLTIVRQYLDGTRVSGNPAIANGLQYDGLAVASARHSGMSLFVITENREVLVADGGLRLGHNMAPDIARALVDIVLENLRQVDLEQPVENLLTTGTHTGYVFVEPIRNPKPPLTASAKAEQGAKTKCPMAVAVWLLDPDLLAQLFAEHGLHGMEMGNMASHDSQRTGIRLGRDDLGVFMSWLSPTVVTSQWMVLVPLIMLALCGVVLAILKSLRFSRKASGLVHAIESAAYDRATRDPLTGLHNRSGFKMRLDDALESRVDQELVGVVYIDLDRFKEVNDGFGHETGDQLLIAVTERLAQVCGRDVTIARLGGDEFAIVVTRRDNAESIVQLGEAISRELGLPFILGTTEVAIGGSVGISIAPEDGRDATELVRRADISMYRAKTGGRGQAIRFHASMEDEIRRRKMLEGELRHAIARGQMEVWYQPFMASDGETLIGVEALMRWTHPIEGNISPAVFIPLAEETGQIVEIGEWAMRVAMQDAMRWPGVHLAINVSPVQFRSKELVKTTIAMIEEIGIERDRVEIEITEGVLMEDADAAVEVIQGFRDERLHVALDDFGTGYASLSYLRRFPFDKLKVDQAFVRNLSVTPGAAAIIHSVVALGRSLGMTVHAEGVETLEHHIFLRAAGCHHFQGYYFSRPMNREATDAFVASRTVGSLYSRRA